MAKTSKKEAAKKIPLTASTADRHVLYEASVQDTDTELEFINRVFKKVRGAQPLSLCEDFCGTAQLCANWVRQGPKHTAVGLDLHQATMNWGKKTHVCRLDSDGQKRVSLLKRNVMDGLDQRVDVTVAFNFSYCALKRRAEMLTYFKRVYRDTCPTGAFFLDIHGGTESFEEMEESSKRRGFTYVWDQEPYDPINGTAMRRIHFRFPDGSEMKNAFSYDWRMWTLPELRDLLDEAGFAQVDIYWEGADKKGNGDGKFRKVRKAENEACFIAYIVAWRKSAKN